MPVRDRITWGAGNPLRDPRLLNLPALVRDFKKGKSAWPVKVFVNRWLDLPVKPLDYYHEYYSGPKGVAGLLRIVLGKGGEVYVTGNHYRDFRQIVGMPVLQ
jgi:hypothetical protein